MDNEPRESRKHILVGVLLVGALAYFGYEYGYRPKAEEIAALESRLETLQLQNQTARILAESDARGEAEQRLEAYRNHLALVERLIPASEELSELLDAISVEAQQAGVELSLIQPTEAVAENQYTRRIYSLGVLGSYHEIGQFLTRIASLPRIITPTDLNIVVRQEGTRSVDPILEAMFAIETYVLPSSVDGGRRAGIRDISPSVTGASTLIGSLATPRESRTPTEERETIPDEVSHVSSAAM